MTIGKDLGSDHGLIVEEEPRGTLRKNRKSPPSILQMKTVYDIVGDIIDNLDEYAMAELMSGNTKDINEILEIVIDITYQSIYTPTEFNYSHTIDYLDKFNSSFEMTLRKKVFNYFVLTVLPKFELSPHIIEWGNFIQLYRLLCLIAARGHAKSHTMSFAYPLWKMYRYTPKIIGSKDMEMTLSRKGMIITNEIGLARTHLATIKEEIENNSILNEMLYPGSNKDWRSDDIVCKNGSSCMIKSYGSKMRGYHPTWIVVDDYLSENVLYSLEQKEKYNSHFESVIMNMLMKGGQIVVIGTPFVAGDLYDKLKKNIKWWVFEYPAILPDGHVLWESEHTAQSLLALRDTIGGLNFSREILVKPITSDTALIQWKHIFSAYAGMEKYTLVNSLRNHPMKESFVKVVVGTDFALSGATGADYTAFYVIGIDSSDKYWLLHVFRGKGMHYSRQLMEAKRINLEFSPDIFVVETNAAQKMFADMMTEAGLPVLEHQTGGEKHSLLEGVPAISILLERQQIRLPRGNPDSINTVDALASQLTSFIYDEKKGVIVCLMEHDDDAMAFWQALRGARYVTGRLDFSFI